jgi:hypothetical protein
MAEKSSVKLQVVRWTARGLSVVMVGILLLFLFGEGDLSEFSKLTLREWIGLLFYPLGVVVGMILAWFRPGVGGTVTVGSLLGFYLVQLLLWGDLPGGPFFVLFASPGFLFLLLAWLRRQMLQGA